MLIWVIGQSGFVGRALCDLCRKKNISFVSSSSREVNITDEIEVENFFSIYQPSHIINCSAYTQVDLAEKQIEQCFAVNAKAPAFLAKIAAKNKARFIHLSTDYVFDGTKKSVYSEEDSCNPLNVYGASKMQGEKAIMQENPQACIIRTSWVFGAGGKNFLSALLDKMQTDKQIKVCADQSSCPTYVNDLCSCLLEMIDCSGIYHFTNENPTSRLDVAQEILAIYREMKKTIACEEIMPVTLSELNLSAKRPLFSALHTKKIARVLQKPPRPWQESIREYVRAI